MLWLVLGLATALPAQVATSQTAGTPAQASGDAYFFFMEGRMLEGRGEVDKAIAAYRRAIQIAPAAADVRAELAGLYARAGKAAEALTEGDAALAADPKNREAHRILGFVQAALADDVPAARRAALLASARDHLEQAISAGGRDPGAELTLGRLYVRTGQFPRAVTTLEAFLVDQPGYAEGMLLLAEAYGEVGQLARAITQLEAVLVEQPDLTRARGWLAELYEQVERWRDAAAAWAEVARKTPTDGALPLRRASALVNAGDVAAARQVVTDLTLQTPRDAAVWLLLSQIERRSGNVEAAEAAARRISDIDSNDPRGPLAMAEAKAARRDFRGVVALLDPVFTALRDADVKSSPYASVASALASALEETGERARGIRVLEDARRRAPDHPGLLYDLAGAYDRDGKFEPAEKAMRDLLAADPAHADALNYLGYMLAEQGQRLDEAITLIKRALAIDAENPSYHDSLGWALFKSRQYADARASLERAAGALPKSSVIQDHLAQVYFQLKQYRDAAAAWDRALAGDRDRINVGAVTKQRDRARELAGK